MNRTMKILRFFSKTRPKTILILVFFGIIVAITPIPEHIQNTSDLLVISTVLLAIIYGFYIATTFTNYTRLQGLVAEETGKLMSLNRIIASIQPNLSQEFKDAIDEYLIASFDVELFYTVAHTWKEFNKIIGITNKIENKESNNYSVILGLTTDLHTIRQDFDVAAHRLMGIVDWIIMIVLVVLNILLLYSIRNTTMVSYIVTVLFSTTLVTLLFLLNSVDNNTFSEEKFAFGIYETTFKEIGKLAYYPEPSIISHRIEPTEGTYRMGVYKDLENSFEKKIVLVKNDK